MMTGFAIASVAGVPLGLFIGTNFGWQMTFIALSVLGLPVLALAWFALPILNDHALDSRVVHFEFTSYNLLAHQPPQCIRIDHCIDNQRVPCFPLSQRLLRQQRRDDGTTVASCLHCRRDTHVDRVAHCWTLCGQVRQVTCIPLHRSCIGRDAAIDNAVARRCGADVDRRFRNVDGL